MKELIITERENIVAIADAVRNKTGLTEELTLNEMISSIINLDVADVPRLPDGVTALSSGIYIPTEDKSSTTPIAHGLSKRPDFYIIMAPGEIQSSKFKNYIIRQTCWYQTFHQMYSSGNTIARTYDREIRSIYSNDGVYAASTGSNETASASITANGGADDSNIYIFCSSTCKLKNSTTYRWVAGCVS